LELALGHVKKFEICVRICADVHNLLHNIIFTSMHLSKERIACACARARTHTHTHTHTSNKANATAIMNKVYAFKVQNSSKNQLLALSCVCMCTGCDWKFCRSLWLTCQWGCSI